MVEEFDGALLPVGAETILHSCVGSTVFGTSVDSQGSDRDEMAIAIEPPEYLVGLNGWGTTVSRSQPKGVRSGPGDLDLQIHSLRKFAQLAVKGNPSILLLLFAPPTFADWQGRELLYYRDRFLSRQAGKAFLGYMNAQRARMNGEQGGRHGRMRTELVDQFGYDTKYAGHIIRLGYQGIELMETGRMTLPMQEHERIDVVNIRRGLWTLKKVLDLALDLQARLSVLMDTSHLPEEPDTHGVNDLLTKWYLQTWAGK